jgi:hypothetical protein
VSHLSAPGRKLETKKLSSRLRYNRDQYVRPSSTRTHEPSLSSRSTRLPAQGHAFAPPKRIGAVATLALGFALQGCPFTDDYFIDHASGGAGSLRVSTGGTGLDGSGGTLSQAGETGVPEGGTPGDGAGATDAAGGTTTVGGSGGAGSAGGSGGTDAGATGGTSQVGGNGGTTGGTAGSDGGSGDRGGTGGDMTAGTGGTSAGAGGTDAAGSTGWTGGRSGWGGRAGSDAGTGGGGSGSDPYQPLCDESIVKGSACTPASPSPCYRACGPNSVGFKSETCQGASYVEQDGCTFPPGDYSCYAVPGHLPADCPGTTPEATNPCSVAACTVCFGGTAFNPQYRDSTGVQKSGYCVCTDAGTWTCASTTSWPCPDSTGCN